jgi:TNF receptor-associated factor 4
MATGFECEFAEKVSKGIQAECPICLLVLREPYQATCCGKSFCKECIESVKATSNKCPTCKAEDFFSYPNLGLQQSLYDFRVYCTYKSKGCEWTGELRELDNHLNSDSPADKSLQGCPFMLIKCPLGCAECLKGMYRKDVKIHINDRLLSRVVMQNTQMETFKQQLQEISTQFKKDKEGLEQRLTELEIKVIELSAENRKLDMQNRELRELKSKQAAVGPSDHPVSKQPPATFVTGTYKPKAAEFTMTDFEKYQMDGDIWYSPHFYTCPNGYKMCLRVDTNGSGSGEGTHLSVYVHLMRGEFDDQLKWPFRGSITVKLVNQEKNKDHVTKAVKYDIYVSEEYNMQVFKKDRASQGPGFHKFIPLAELRPKYLKNNCIKLCIQRVELL